MLTKDTIEKALAERRIKQSLLKAYQDSCRCGEAKENLWWHEDKQEIFNTPPRNVPEGWEPGMEAV